MICFVPYFYISCRRISRPIPFKIQGTPVHSTLNASPYSTANPLDYLAVPHFAEFHGLTRVPAEDVWTISWGNMWVQHARAYTYGSFGHRYYASGIGGTFPQNK